MRERVKIITAMLVVVFVIIDSSYLFCLHSSLLNEEIHLDNVVGNKDTPERKSDNHDPIHELHHAAQNIVDVSIEIDTPLVGIAFVPALHLFDALESEFSFPLLYLQQKFKFPTVKSRLYFISSLLI